jgi:hypothetical protein
MLFNYFMLYFHDLQKWICLPYRFLLVVINNIMLLAPFIHLATTKHQWLFFCFFPIYVWFSNWNFMFPKKLWLQNYFINCYWKFKVYFFFSFWNPNYQIDLSQIIEYKMSKENLIELFVLEESIVVEGVGELFEPL